MNLQELLSQTSSRGVWEMVAVSKCGTAIKFKKSSGAEIIVTISKIRQWLETEKCTVKGNQLIWNIENLSNPEF